MQRQAPNVSVIFFCYENITKEYYTYVCLCKLPNLFKCFKDHIRPTNTFFLKKIIISLRFCVFI